MSRDLKAKAVINPLRQSVRRHAPKARTWLAQVSGCADTLWPIEQSSRGRSGQFMHASMAPAHGDLRTINMKIEHLKVTMYCSSERKSKEISINEDEDEDLPHPMHK